METCVDEPAEQLARQVIERMGYEGIAEVEILRDEESGRDWVVEINPRPWSQYALAPAAGYDFLGLALGRAVSPPASFTRVRWLDWTGDLYHALSRKGMIARGELTWERYLRSLLRANCWSTFDLHDLRPFFTDLATLFRR
jgi:predicted ATP-grasp superfamily ATP-dependent carboligase